MSGGVTGVTRVGAIAASEITPLKVERTHSTEWASGTMISAKGNRERKGMTKVGKYSVSGVAFGTKGSTVDPELLALVQESWEQRETDSKRGVGFAIPVAELDAEGRYDRAVNKLRRAAGEAGLGLYARAVTDDDGVDCVGFAAQEKRAYNRSAAVIAVTGE